MRQPALSKAWRKEQLRVEQWGSQVLVFLQQYPSRLPSSNYLLGGAQFSHLQNGNYFPARLYLPGLPHRLRKMGRDTGVKAPRNVMPSAQQGLCSRAGAGLPLLTLQTVLQLCNPGLHLHHQALFAGPVGTFQVDNPAL